MGTVYLLVGNFGVGKTSITNFYEHTTCPNMPYTEVNGVVSLGGKDGADTLSKRGYDKRRVYTEIIPKLHNRKILVHSVFYQSIQDINRFSRTHKVVVIYLNTQFANNMKRIEMRSNGKKHIDPKTYGYFVRYVETIRQFCVFSKVPFYEVDNNRSLEEVSQDVWRIISQ